MRCEIQLSIPADSESTEVAIATSSARLKVPATVGARAGQSRVRFEIAADAVASYETVILTADIGKDPAQTTIVIEPSDFPELNVPAEVNGTPGMPLRFTVNAPEGIRLTAANLPRRARFEPDSGVLEWTPVQQDLGDYGLSFTATNAVGIAATKKVNLTIDTGKPVLTKLQNTAGSDGPAGCTAGSAATVHGRWLFGGALPAVDPSGASNELSETRVLVNGEYAPILYASENRVDLVCPSGAVGTPVSIVVETAAGRSNVLEGTIQGNAPGLMVIDRSGQASAVRSGTQETAAIPNERLSGRPAMAGDTLAFQVVGIDCSAESAIRLSMEIGLDVVPVKMLRPAAGQAGICEIQVVVPPSAAGDVVPVRLQFRGPDGITRASNPATIGVAVH
jgi:uncharacterized protein (TIGR03437 family)